MSFQVFQFPLPGPGDLGDLNRFLAAHRVVAVKQHLVATPEGGLLVFVVETVAGAPASEIPRRKIDYKAELTPDQFAVFSRLRDARKTIAAVEGVPVYTVFSNEQLAEMVRRPVSTLADLEAIEGIGKARLEKHGARLLELLAATATENETNHS